MKNQNTINNPKTVEQWQVYHSTMNDKIETARKAGDAQAVANASMFRDMAAKKIAELLAQTPNKPTAPAKAPTIAKTITKPAAATPATATAPTTKTLSAEDFRETLKPKMVMRMADFRTLTVHEQNEYMAQKGKLVD